MSHVDRVGRQRQRLGATVHHGDCSQPGRVLSRLDRPVSRGPHQRWMWLDADDAAGLTSERR